MADFRMHYSAGRSILKINYFDNGFKRSPIQLPPEVLISLTANRFAGV